MNFLKNIIFISLFSIFIISCSKEDPYPERPVPIASAFVNPTIGGANEQNQVYFDLSTNTETAIQRDSWDLRFYNDNEFRVSLNTSVFMATKKLDATDINSVNTTTVQDLFNTVTIGTFNADNVAFVDDFDGNILNTAIDEISNNDSENKVYLLNLGYEVGTETPQIGNVAVTGNHRSWKKIRILKQNEKYVLQYANLDDTTYQEVTIAKNTSFNFQFFSFNTDVILNVEPEKLKWDFCFTVFTNEIPGYGTYGYTDFIITNNLQNVLVYAVSVADFDFDTFLISDIITNDFITSQRAIGSSWRFGGGPGVSPQVNNTNFYVLKDAEGIYYKLKFLTLTNEEGERGFPQFQYAILNNN